MSAKLIFILSSIHHVLKAEKVLKKTPLPFDLIPVPKEVNPDCGMALEIDSEYGPMVTAALTRAGLEVEAEYRRDDQGFHLVRQGRR
jgi:hypothetical protein